MSVLADTSPRPGTGRHRDAALDGQILHSVVDLLGEVGYDALSIEGVARRSGVAKTTIYRRWSTKAELIVAAIEWRHDLSIPMAARDTGSLRGDLLVEIERMGRVMETQTIAQMAGVFLAMRREPELAVAFHARVIAPNQLKQRDVLHRAFDRGEIPASALDLTLFDQIIPSMILGRRFALDLPVDPAFAAELVDAIILPALMSARRHTSRSPAQNPAQNPAHLNESLEK